MAEAKYDNLLLYVETCYEALGKPLPRKEDGGVDVIRCKAVLRQLAHNGIVQPFDQWHKEMFGVMPDGGDGFRWPADIAWPPPPSESVIGVYDG